MGEVGASCKSTYLKLKDSNAAVGVRDPRGKTLEGADRQTDRQTNFLRIIPGSKIIMA